MTDDDNEELTKDKVDTRSRSLVSVISELARPQTQSHRDYVILNGPLYSNIRYAVEL